MTTEAGRIVFFKKLPEIVQGTFSCTFDASHNQSLQKRAFLQLFSVHFFTVLKRKQKIST